MASGMVLLFTLLLVSDWFKLVEAFVTVTNTTMCWFFILFYILGVLIILNIVVAVILGAFLGEWKRARSQESKVCSILHSMPDDVYWLHPVVQPAAAVLHMPWPCSEIKAVPLTTIMYYTQHTLQQTQLRLYDRNSMNSGVRVAQQQQQPNRRRSSVEPHDSTSSRRSSRRSSIKEYIIEPGQGVTLQEREALLQKFLQTAQTTSSSSGRRRVVTHEEPLL
eukprot:5616-Heterococcus_DN1.PRE.1